nr:CHAT domain-containing protein [candidate division Zixibacteria bacterium]
MISIGQFHKFRNRQVLERYITRKHGGDIAKFLTDVDISLNHIIKADMKKMGECVDDAKQIFKYLPQQYKPRLYQIIGRYNNFKANYRAALKYYLRAREMHEKAGNTEAVARLNKGLIDVYNYLGQYDESLRIGRMALRFFRRKRFIEDAGQVLVNIGNIYHRMDNNPMALRYYNRARKIFVKTGGYQLAITEFNRANVYANLNQIRKAETLYRCAAALYHEAGMEISVLRAESALAYLLYLGNRYTESLTMFERTNDRMEQLGSVRPSVILLLDLVEINAKLNQYGSAILLAETLIPRLKKYGMPYEMAKTYYFAADALIRVGDYDRASRMLKQAVRVFEEERNVLWLGMVSIAESRLYQAEGKYGPAIKSATEARSYFRRSGDEVRRIDAEITMVEAYQCSGDMARADRVSKRLLKMRLLSYQKYNLYYPLGQGYYTAGQYDKAYAMFKKAITEVEKMLSGLYPDEIRFFFMTDKYDCYRMAVECLLRLGRTRESFITSLKGIELVNQKSAFEKKIQAEVPAELLEKRDRLRAALKRLSQTAPGEQRSSGNMATYYSIEQKLWYNERKIRASLYPDEKKVRRKTSAEFDPRRLLQKDETMVSFFSSGAMSGAFCAAADKIDFVRFDITREELEVMLRKLHFIFEKSVFGLRDVDRTRQIADYYLELLYRRIFRPVESYLSGRKVIAITDSSFGQIPLIALRDEAGIYLKDKYDIRILVNPGDLKRRLVSDDRMVKTRNAIFAVSSDSLPSIDREANEINKLFEKSRLYLDKTASCHNLSEELKEVDGFVHIAAHASRSSENPLFSMILMGDGPFYPFDLFESGVRARLVTLSGCQTAAPGLYYGNSFSLAKAFYQAGSQHVLASLWPVSDKLSMLFMIEFYKTLAKVGNVYSAYQNAVNRIIDITDNPAFWSSFVLLGI